MKVCLKSMLIVAIMLSCVYMVVDAQNVYYTNDNNIQMTELEYNKLLSIFGEKRLAILTQEEFDEYKNANIISSSAVYEKTTYKNGELVSSEMVSAEEYNAASESESSSGVVPADSDYQFYETSYKKLMANLVDTGRFSLMATLAWKKVPACRSYDVFAYRFMHFDYSGFTGTQVYTIDGQNYYIDYTTASAGYKAQSTGAGVSMNLKDGSDITDYEMTVATNLTLNTSNYSQAHAYVTYQHAQSDLTRAQSMSYTLDISGLGNVVYYSDTSIRYKYDAMTGLHLTTPI